MAIYNPKTDDELLADVRHTAWLIGDASNKIPKTTAAIRRLESYSNALTIYCKLLADRLDVGPSAAVEHLRASLEGE
jgi:hypothetical protein